MQLSQIIHLNTVYIDTISQSKMAVLLKLSQLVSQNHPNLNSQELFDAYWKRETLGSTALGQGVAIPHIRTTGLTKPQGCVMRLLNPVDFGAEDKQPIDLIIGLLVPQEQVDQHLKILAEIVKQFSIASFREACRRVNDQEEFYNLLISAEELPA